MCEANQELQRQRLVIYSFGNVSGIDRASGTVLIKPSGVAYEELTPEKMVAVELASGKVLEGKLRPSSDTPTHLELYRAFPGLGGICHTHSPNATLWAQAGRAIPCLGTTHADYFYGDIPVTAALSAEEINNEYEANTGRVIVRRFAGRDPLQMPAVLVAQHGPFTWGPDPAHAVEIAVILEQVAAMALGALAVNPAAPPISRTLLDKHYLRKHGANAYYGQK